MVPRIPKSRRIPKLVKFYALIIRLHIVESSIGYVPQVHCIAHVVIACNLEVSLRMKEWKRIAEPHDISILKCRREEIVISSETTKKKPTVNSSKAEYQCISTR
jgi:hypothetical protein